MSPGGRPEVPTCEYVADGGVGCNTPSEVRLRRRSDLSGWKPYVCHEHRLYLTGPVVRSRGIEWIVDRMAREDAR